MGCVPVRQLGALVWLLGFPIPRPVCACVTTVPSAGARRPEGRAPLPPVLVQALEVDMCLFSVYPWQGSISEPGLGLLSWWTSS